jgi:hypothetical protein
MIRQPFLHLRSPIARREDLDGELRSESEEEFRELIRRHPVRGWYQDELGIAGIRRTYARRRSVPESAVRA